MRFPVPVGFVFYLQLWRVAMRLRAGLPLPPAFTEQPLAACALLKHDGGRCSAPLDIFGNHPLTCPCEGQFCSRHDLIVQFLARALKRFDCHVKTEQWCYELYDRDKKRHARMDLVVHFKGQVFYLDVTVVHCMSGKGVVNEGGRLASAEKKKHERYRTVVNGVRVTPARFVPIALSSLGAVGQEAQAFFSMLGSAARSDDGGEPPSSQSLVGLCSFLAAMFSARNAMTSFVSPDHGPAGCHRGRARRASNA